jgi:hypothetical protein
VTVAFVERVLSEVDAAHKRQHASLSHSF